MESVMGVTWVVLPRVVVEVDMTAKFKTYIDKHMDRQ